MQRSENSTSSITPPPLSRTVEFDVKPVMQRYGSSSSISKTSQLAEKVSEKIQSKSRCALFFYNVPRSSIMLTIPGFVFLLTGACLVATKYPFQDWLSDSVLNVAFVFLVVGGVWSIVAVVFWIAIWFHTKPSLLPRNLNKLPKNTHLGFINVSNANNSHSNVNCDTSSVDQNSNTNQSSKSCIISDTSDTASPYSKTFPNSLDTSTYNRNISQEFSSKNPDEPHKNMNTE